MKNLDLAFGRNMDINLSVIKLSTLAVTMGLGFGLPQIYWGWRSRRLV